MVTLIESTLDGVVEVFVFDSTWDVTEAKGGCVDTSTALSGYTETAANLQGGVPSPFDVVEQLWMASLPFDIAFSPDVSFVAYTDAKRGDLAYLIYEDGNRALLEQGGYIVL